VNKFLTIVFVGILASGATFAEESASENVPEKGVRYKKGKDINFEELVIQGQLKRPEISVVTGNVNEGDDGLLRLRENFMDRIAEDVGEEIP
jgi:hypothetical protein